MKNTLGIVFNYRSRFFKLLDIEWGKDNSFYCIPYQHPTEVGVRLKAVVNEGGRLVLDINEIQHDCFPMKKISRHTSGVYHIKDVVGAGGNRENAKLKGPAFKEIEGLYTFLAACPQAIDTLVEIRAPSSGDLVAHLPDSIEPFTVQFGVRSKSTATKLARKPEYMGVFSLTIDHLDFGLVVKFIKVGKPSPDARLPFPKRTCYIVR